MKAKCEKASLFLFLFAFSSSAFSEVKSNILCFTTGNSKPIRFEMRTFIDTDSKWQGGYIKYENSKSTIPIIPVGDRHEMSDSESIDPMGEEWLEISNKKISGDYEVIQGDRISMSYFNVEKRGKYTFWFDPGVNTDDKLGCQWN